MLFHGQTYTKFADNYIVNQCYFLMLLKLIEEKSRLSMHIMYVVANISKSHGFITITSLIIILSTCHLVRMVQVLSSLHIYTIHDLLQTRKSVYL